jgi:hypothetical protein
VAENWKRSLRQNVPLFMGLAPKQVERFLAIGRSAVASAGEVLCEQGTPSNKLFLLVQGLVEIVAPNGTCLATVRPVTTVGEMGFVSRKPRSATVKAREECHLLAIEYHAFKTLMDSDLAMQARIYHNMVRLLSDRLSDANDMVVRYRNLYEASKPAEPPVGVAVQPEPAAAPPGQAAAASPAATGVPPVAPPPEAVAGAAPPLPSQGLSEADLVRGFYRAVGVQPESGQLANDVTQCAGLLQDGYSVEDIAYAIKWTARHIPGAKRFSLVKASIREAFEEKWSV